MKFTFFAGISGFLIITLFVGCAAFLYLNKEHISYDKETMSSIASNPRYTNYVRAFCWTVSLLIIPYTIGLIKHFDIEINSPTVLIGVLASISLFLTALSINRPESHLHQISSLVFYISLFIMPLHIAFTLLETESKLIGYLVFSLFIVSLVLLAGNCLKEKGKPDGFTEALLMATNSAWVIIYAVQMLGK